MALIFALFTIVVLCAISTTVTALAVNNSQDVKRFNANELVLHAANWGIEAAINYMGAGDKCDGTSIGCALSWNGIHITEELLSKSDLSSFGLSESKLRPSGSNYDIGKVSLITFHDGTDDGTPHRLNDQLNHSFLVGVVKVELKYQNGQPSLYNLRSIAKMTEADYGTLGKNLKVGNLSDCNTRVVDARVREQTTSDFMQFIENARSWDANGVDLSSPDDVTLWSTGVKQDLAAAKSAVLIPEGYHYEGDFYVCGHSDTTTNAARSNLRGKWDGRLGFFAEGDFDPSKYHFTGNVTTKYGVDTYAYRNRGVHVDNPVEKVQIQGIVK